MAHYDEDERVEVRLTLDEVWTEACYLKRHGSMMHLVWLERSMRSVVLPDNRVRPMNRPSLADVG